MLVGALSGSELVVTAVLVPNQRGSSDMCEMTNEEEIWECVPSYARNRRSCRSRRNPPLRRHIDQDQINLGWVHTHPTQTSFMSSIDLHIHMPYQMLLDEVAAYRGRTHPAFEADDRINTPTLPASVDRDRSLAEALTVVPRLPPLPPEPARPARGAGVPHVEAGATQSPPPGPQTRRLLRARRPRRPARRCVRGGSARAI